MTEHDDDDVEPRYVSLGQLARYVGVSVRTIQRLRRRGVLPSSLFCTFSRRLVRVDLVKFQEWLDQWDGVIRDPAPRRAPEPRPPESDGPRMRLLS